MNMELNDSDGGRVWSITGYGCRCRYCSSVGALRDAQGSCVRRAGLVRALRGVCVRACRHIHHVLQSSITPTCSYSINYNKSAHWTPCKVLLENLVSIISFGFQLEHDTRGIQPHHSFVTIIHLAIQYNT